LTAKGQVGLRLRYRGAGEGGVESVIREWLTSLGGNAGQKVGIRSGWITTSMQRAKGVTGWNGTKVATGTRSRNAGRAAHGEVGESGAGSWVHGRQQGFQRARTEFGRAGVVLCFEGSGVGGVLLRDGTGLRIEIGDVHGTATCASSSGFGKIIGLIGRLACLVSAFDCGVGANSGGASDNSASSSGASTYRSQYGYSRNFTQPPSGG
jgi:hypothetical protein